MEIESKNGFKFQLQKASEIFEFGRDSGFNSTDRTVSRRHVSFKLHENQPRVYFEVKGKNPVWVRESENGKIRVYKTSESGELKLGDLFCVSSKNPVWFDLKKIDENDEESEKEMRYDDVLAESSGSGIDYDEIEAGDASEIDPVKEFNFVVIGHEFDSYLKKLIKDIKNWNWYLEEPKKGSDDDEDDSERKPKKDMKRKRKKGRKNDDDDDDVWTGESEEDVETIKKLRNVPKPKYSTRSKNKKGASVSKNATKSYAKDDDEDEDEYEEDEDDETLSGFIVDDEDAKEDEEDDEEEEDEDEEEEFEEDEDE